MSLPTVLGRGRPRTLPLALLALAAGCAPRGAAHPSQATSWPDDPSHALDDVAHGRRSLYSLAEPGVGLAIALHRSDPSGEDPAADAEGNIRQAERVCDATAPALARVERGLAVHFDPAFDYVPLRCEGSVCEARGPMEFATSLRFVFEPVPGGGVVLRSVLEVEDVAMMDELVHRAWNWAELAVEELPPRCPGR